MITKGGVTSRDVVADALRWDAALVLGPLIDQTLPVWNLLARALTRLKALTTA